MNAKPIERTLTPLTTVRQASPQDFLNKQPVVEKVGKKKKKKKGMEELAPLGGVLPPTAGNNFMRAAIPSIQKKTESKGINTSTFILSLNFNTQHVLFKLDFYWIFQ